jgi:hypothetical protein
MNKSEARDTVLSGKITLGMLRASFSHLGARPSWRRSVVNNSLTQFDALEILRKAIAADTRSDDTVMNSKSRDILVATNVVREVGFVAILSSLEIK